MERTSKITHFGTPFPPCQCLGLSPKITGSMVRCLDGRQRGDRPHNVQELEQELVGCEFIFAIFAIFLHPVLPEMFVGQRFLPTKHAIWSLSPRRPYYSCLGDRQLLLPVSKKPEVGIQRGNNAVQTNIQHWGLQYGVQMEVPFSVEIDPIMYNKSNRKSQAANSFLTFAPFFYFRLALKFPSGTVSCPQNTLLDTSTSRSLQCCSSCSLAPSSTY